MADRHAPHHRGQSHDHHQGGILAYVISDAIRAAEPLPGLVHTIISRPVPPSRRYVAYLLTRLEGWSPLANQPFASTSINDANNCIRAWAYTAPAPDKGYDKVSVVAYRRDGSVRRIRYDMTYVDIHLPNLGALLQG